MQRKGLLQQQCQTCLGTLMCYEFWINNHIYGHGFFKERIYSSLQFQGKKVYNGEDGRTVGAGSREIKFHPHKESKNQEQEFGQFYK